jgi:hypothetical protein
VCVLTWHGSVQACSYSSCSSGSQQLLYRYSRPRRHNIRPSTYPPHHHYHHHHHQPQEQCPAGIHQQQQQHPLYLQFHPKLPARGAHVRRCHLGHGVIIALHAPAPPHVVPGSPGGRRGWRGQLGLQHHLGILRRLLCRVLRHSKVSTHSHRPPQHTLSMLLDVPAN